MMRWEIGNHNHFLLPGTAMYYMASNGEESEADIYLREISYIQLYLVSTSTLTLVRDYCTTAV